jgi:hypothetical protein
LSGSVFHPYVLPPRSSRTVRSAHYIYLLMEVKEKELVEVYDFGMEFIWSFGGVTAVRRTRFLLIDTEKPMPYEPEKPHRRSLRLPVYNYSYKGKVGR